MPGFNPDKFIAKMDEDEPKAFDPDDFVSRFGDEKHEDDPDMLESAIRGGAQGATLGHADEMSAGVSGVYDWLQAKMGNRGDISLSDAYDTHRNAIRNRDKKAKEVNPGTFKTAEIAGAIAPAFVGSGGVAAAKGLRGAANAVGGGLAAGSGYSEGDLGSRQHLTDTAVGGVIGGATFGALKGAGAAGRKVINSGVGQKTVQGAKNIAAKGSKKLLSNFGGVKEDMIEKYLKRPDQINRAREFDEIGEEIVGSVEKLKDRVISGSSDATDLIPDNVEIPRGEVADVIRSLRGNFKEGITDESEAAYKELGRWLGRINKEGDQLDNLFPENELAKMDFGSIDIKGLTGPSKTISGKNLKSLIKEVDRSIQKSDRAGEFMTPGHAAKGQFRSSIDEKLKDSAPDYRDAMVKVAKDAEALNVGKKMFPRVSGAAGKAKNMAQNPTFNPDARAALGGMDKRLGTSLLDEADDRIVRRAFETDGTRGSRNAVRFGALGAFIGSPLGTFGMTSGATTGAMIGSVIDKKGGQLTKGILDLYLKAQSRGGPQIPQSLNNLAMRYGPILQKAAERGEPAMGATHYVLIKNDPEYKRMLTEALGGETQMAAKKPPTE